MNILLVLADDIGVDNVSSYGEQPNHSAQTPTLDELANSGVLFRNAWANPMCSPSRASILTGRHAFRHGVTHPAGATGTLSGSEQTLAELLSDTGYNTALFGKWHLGQSSGSYPSDQGFDYFSGSLSNLDNYFTWEKTLIEGRGGSVETIEETRYATEVAAEEASAWIQEAGQPWFVELAFNAPHAPYHVPPANRYTGVSLSGSEGDDCNMSPASDNVEDCFRASAEAMDSYLQDFLNTLDEQTLANTVIIFAGDNGTPGEAVVEEQGIPFSTTHAKGTVYQGGVNVPLIIWGGSNTGIDVSEITDNIQIQDIFSTILSLANSSASDNVITDGQSLVGYIDSESTTPSGREILYSELYSSTQNIDRWAVSDGAIKYINNEGTEECYDLESDSGETLDQYTSSGSITGLCDNLRASRPE